MARDISCERPGPHITRLASRTAQSSHSQLQSCLETYASPAGFHQHSTLSQPCSESASWTYSLNFFLCSHCAPPQVPSLLCKFFTGSHKLICGRSAIHLVGRPGANFTRGVWASKRMDCSSDIYRYISSPTSGVHRSQTLKLKACGSFKKFSHSQPITKEIIGMRTRNHAVDNLANV